MPTAPRLIEDQATLQDRGGRLQPVDTPDEYGAGVGRALSGLGEVGVQISGEVYRREAERDAQEGDIAFQRRAREIMLGRQADPGDPLDVGVPGFLSYRGEDAAAHRVQMEAALNQARDEIATSRRSHGARTAFLNVSGSRLESNLGEADNHVLTQTKAAQDSTRAALAQESANTAIASYMDEGEAAANINTGIGVVTQQADADGASPERTEQMIRDFQSSAWAQVILRRADLDPEGADRIFQARRGMMNAEDVSHIEEATKQVRLADRARHNTDTFLAQTGGDYTAALHLADGIENTQERDETQARIINQGRSQSEAEASVANEAEMRARTSISRGGFGSVSGSDRAILQRDGRWNALIRDYQSAQDGAGQAAARRDVENQKNMILGIGIDDPHSFHIVVDAMRGVQAPNVSDQDVLNASGGLTRAQLVQLRTRMVSIDADSWNQVEIRQQEMRGQRPVGGSNSDAVARLYERLNTFGAPMAAQRGIYVGAPSIGQSITGTADAQLKRSGQWRGFLYHQAQAFVLANQGAEASQADMDAIVNTALQQSGGHAAFEAAPATQPGFFGMGTGEVRVTIPFNRIPREDQLALAQQWRQHNPNVVVRTGSREERDRNAWIEQMYAANLERY